MGFMEGKHLILYDGTCGFCHKTIQFVLKQDRQKIFLFAPLQGETAKKYNFDKDLDTVILIENFKTQPQITMYGQAALRICWLLGGVWAIAGSASFLPPILYNWKYNFIARHRYKLAQKEVCLIPPQEDQTRFLP